MYTPMHDQGPEDTLRNVSQLRRTASQGAPQRDLFATVRHGNTPARTSPAPRVEPVSRRGSGHPGIIKKATLTTCAVRTARYLESMSNTMNSTTVSAKSSSSVKLIENVVADVYGVNALNCDAITIEWAADKVAASHGVEKAAKEWKRVNGRRYRLGLYTTIPQYGTALYAAYFA